MKFFWSWQTDTPSKTGPYFVRDALLAAIKQLRQPEDVEEPTSAAHREAMELTSDREGVTGSPPLAATIKKKIDNCEVFVADVTPVSKVPRRKGVKEKRNMNINVGIELGYPFTPLPLYFSFTPLLLYSFTPLLLYCVRCLPSPERGAA